MLLNFCDSRLRPDIQCSTISTEGYEVTNLINDSSEGFLAYSCIRPPVNIDITFICNVQINHILIWPTVGCQKSSGFQLYGKTTNDKDTPYTLLSTGFLGPNDSGVLFYPASIDHEKISTPSNFLKRYIKVSMSYLTSYVNSLRVCICKTEKSVPALGKIEVWGRASPRCGKDVVASIHSLWLKHQTPALPAVKTNTAATSNSTNSVDTRSNIQSLDVPECFLDAITWEIMIQPIILPSGKVIDRTTLEKHEGNEALWGRPATDPFTGIPFSDTRKPVIASALKARIDKFLLENSNADEVKKLPRIVGNGSAFTARIKRSLETPKTVPKENSAIKTSSVIKRKVESETVTRDSQKTKNYCHKLPITVMCQKRVNIARPAKIRKTLNTSVPVHANVCDKKTENTNDVRDISDINTNIDENTSDLLPNLKRFSVVEKRKLDSVISNCNCCTNSILYRLPCAHVVCRNLLISVNNNQCKSCGTSYKSNEVERIHE